MLGIEVPPTAALAIRERCDLGIIDPQHTQGKRRCAAIEVLEDGAPQRAFLDAYKNEHGPDVYLVTSRFDLDAAAAMNLLMDRARNINHLEPLTVTSRSIASEERRRRELLTRIELIDAADNFQPGTQLDWPGPQPLPTHEQPWTKVGGVGEVEELSAPNQLTNWTVTEPRLTLEQALDGIRVWLREGVRPLASYDNDPIALAKSAVAKSEWYLLLQCAQRAALQARLELVDALARGEIKPMLVCHGRAAFIDLTESKLASNSTAGIGYCVAPVSAVHLFDGRAGFPRFSVASFNPRYLNFDSFVREINAIERGGGKWGGNRATGMIGSPQDLRSTVTREEFLACLERSLDI